MASPPALLDDRGRSIPPQAIERIRQRAGGGRGGMRASLSGAVGVIYMHVSFEEALKKAGIEVTLITKGDLKGEGSDMKNLSEDAFKRMKADVLAVGDIFDATVARNRGMKQKDVFATQAGTFLGGQGVDVGFADAVMSPDAAFRALLKQLG